MWSTKGLIIVFWAMACQQPLQKEYPKAALDAPMAGIRIRNQYQGSTLVDTSKGLYHHSFAYNLEGLETARLKEIEPVYLDFGIAKDFQLETASGKVEPVICQRIVTGYKDMLQYLLVFESAMPKDVEARLIYTDTQFGLGKQVNPVHLHQNRH